MGAAASRAAAAAAGLACSAELAAGLFETYVERGFVEPYSNGTEEVVFLQGRVSSSSASAPAVWLERSSPIQTSQDILVAHLRSDDDWQLYDLRDCWQAGFEEDYCCSGADEGCWGGVFNHDRCCVRGRAGRAYLQRDGRGAREAASPLLMRYGLDEELFEARRLRWRRGRQPAACAYHEVAPPPLPLELQGHPETGLRAAFAVLAAAGLASRRALHVGVQDGKSLDPLYPLIATEGVRGLGLEADPAMVEAARANLPAHFRVNHSFATPENIWRWARPLGPLDVVVVDIDSFDCAVLEGLVDGALRSGRTPPALLHFETNMVVPPPFKFTRAYHAGFKGRPEKYAEQQLASTSCSLAYALDAFGARGYELLFFGYDSIFVRRDLTPHFEAAWGRRFPQDEFECYRRSVVHVASGPLRYVREWFFRANDPEDLDQTLALIRDNLTLWSSYEYLHELPWVVFV